MDFDANSWLIFLFKLPSKMFLHKSRFACAGIADDEELEARVIDSLQIRQGLKETRKGNEKEIKKGNKMRAKSKLAIT